MPIPMVKWHTRSGSACQPQTCSCLGADINRKPFLSPRDNQSRSPPWRQQLIQRRPKQPPASPHHLRATIFRHHGINGMAARDEAAQKENVTHPISTISTPLRTLETILCIRTRQTRLDGTQLPADWAGCESQLGRQTLLLTAQKTAFSRGTMGGASDRALITEHL